MVNVFEDGYIICLLRQLVGEMSSNIQRRIGMILENLFVQISFFRRKSVSVETKMEQVV